MDPPAGAGRLWKAPARLEGAERVRVGLVDGFHLGAGDPSGTALDPLTLHLDNRHFAALVHPIVTEVDRTVEGQDVGRRRASRTAFLSLVLAVFTAFTKTSVAAAQEP